MPTNITPGNRDKQSQDDEPSASGFFQKILGMFGMGDPDADKKRLVKNIGKDLSRSRYRFYKPKSSEALPGLEETAPPADPASALDALRQEVLPCIACGLAETRKNVVFGSGSARAELMIVGEAPGRDEDIQGQPFVGRSGQLLTKILAAIGLRRDEVYIGNILKCRPPDNRDPLPPEVLACEPHLRRQLAIIRPRLICCLGRVAAQTLLRTSTSLTRLRGEVHFYGDIPVLATFHPAYLLRNPAAKRDAWNDVRMMKALMEALAAADPGRGA